MKRRRGRWLLQTSGVKTVHNGSPWTRPPGTWYMRASVPWNSKELFNPASEVYPRNYLHPTVLMESDPAISCPLTVSPKSDTEVTPHTIPVSWVLKWRTMSMSPSPSTSSRVKCTGAASVPVAPKRTVLGSTVVPSKVSVVRMATGTFPLLLGLILSGKLIWIEITGDDSLIFKNAEGGNSKERKATNGPMLGGPANRKLNPANASPAATALRMKEVTSRVTVCSPEYKKDVKRDP